MAAEEKEVFLVCLYVSFQVDREKQYQTKDEIVADLSMD
jgi:hypothetical protein